MWRRPRGSSPVVGSSRKITRGEPISVIARSRRRRIPPEYVDKDFFRADSHPELTFRSTDVELLDDGGATVTGELTIRGVRAIGIDWRPLGVRADRGSGEGCA
jgi:hypothetical protein